MTCPNQALFQTGKQSNGSFENTHIGTNSKDLNSSLAFGSRGTLFNTSRGVHFSSLVLELRPHDWYLPSK